MNFFVSNFRIKFGQGRMEKQSLRDDVNEYGI